MKRNILIGALAACMLSSCGEYNKLLKSSDYEYKYELSGYSQEFIKYHDERVNNSISNSYECIHTNSGVFVYPKYQSDDEYWNSYYTNALGIENFKFEY